MRLKKLQAFSPGQSLDCRFHFQRGALSLANNGAHNLKRATAPGITRSTGKPSLMLGKASFQIQGYAAIKASVRAF